MKRDLDLIREILFVVEHQRVTDKAITLHKKQFVDKFPEITDDMLDEHIRLLVEQNLLESEPHQLGWFILRLTWSGHDFLQHSKMNSIWQKTKKVASDFSLDLVVSTLKDYAADYLKSVMIGNP